MLTAEEIETFRESWRPTPEKVDLAVRTAVQIARPSRVFIFGSWARREATIDSDLDLAVLVPDERSNEIGELRKRILRAFGDIRMSIDLVLASEGLASEFLDSINSIYFKILRKGELVYDARNQQAGASITAQAS
jgi:predicted nucleotidyltransferase